MKYRLPKLPFIQTEVRGLFSERQLDRHYHGHHEAYIKKVNKEIMNTELEQQSLIDLMRSQNRLNKKLANNAAQAWNHAFYWNCIGAKSDKESPLFASLCANRHCSVDDIKQKFITKGVQLFGSGYIWIVLNRDSSLKVLSAKNAANPLLYDQDCLPLLAVDVWEHAYYLDFEMDREKYLNEFWGHVNWAWVDELLSDRSNLVKIESSMLVGAISGQSAVNKTSFKQNDIFTN